MQRIVFFEIEEWEKSYLEDRLPEFEIEFSTQKLSRENIDLAKNAEIISVFADSQVKGDLLSQLPNVKLIATRSTGFDHIDLEIAKKRGIVVCNVPTYGENTVAEHTFGLILNLSRKMYWSIEQVKEGDFSLDGLRGFDLKGKTIGIVGMGHIGQHVARIANGFEMKVLSSDAYQDKKLGKKLNFQYVPIETLLENSDIITFHIPLNDHTKHLINSSNIHLIKKGAYLINTARGGIVETAALVEALGDGTLAGAGLDVLEEECSIKEERQLLSKSFTETCDLKTVLENHILIQQKNVLITPHNAFNSQEALERILEATIENIQSYAKGKPTNLVL